MKRSSQSKSPIIADAHKNPEYAAMSAIKLSKIIDVSQTVISKWRRQQRMKSFAEENPVAAKKHGITRDGRKLPPKVTVASVRRKWESKYAALNSQYEYIAGQLIEMAKNADKHRNAQKNLEVDLKDAKETIEFLNGLLREKTMEKKSWISRLFNLKD